MAIYDCFTFFNELGILEIRLNELYDVVDYFVIVEAKKTHSGQQKELYFQANRDKFKKFEDKIIYIVTDLPPIKNNDRWELENYQRDQIDKGLSKCNDDDIILISDADEIPKKEDIPKICRLLNSFQIFDFGWIYLILDTIFDKLSKSKKKSKLGSIIRRWINKIPRKVVVLRQKLFYYYFNGLVCDKKNIPIRWHGTRACKYKYYKDIFRSKPNKVRDAHSIIKLDSGYHFTWIGDVEKIIKKLHSYAHSEWDTNEYTSKEHIINAIKNRVDIFTGEYHNIKIVEIDKTFPEYLYTNQNKFRKYIFRENKNENS